MFQFFIIVRIMKKEFCVIIVDAFFLLKKRYIFLFYGNNQKIKELCLGKSFIKLILDILKMSKIGKWPKGLGKFDFAA